MRSRDKYWPWGWGGMFMQVQDTCQSMAKGGLNAISNSYLISLKMNSFQRLCAA